MKDHVRQSFRWAAHTLGIANVKPRDYVEQEVPVEAATPYSTWTLCRDSDSPLEVGDLLQADTGTLYLYKYVGFEEARWVLPEAKSDAAAGVQDETASAGTVHG